MIEHIRELLPGSIADSETPAFVQWTTNGAGCPECQEAEAEGVQPLGHIFVTGVDAPPAHPHCACTLQDASDTDDYYEYISG